MEVVVVADDCALEGVAASGSRGIAGTALVHKARAGEWRLWGLGGDWASLAPGGYARQELGLQLGFVGVASRPLAPEMTPAWHVRRWPARRRRPAGRWAGCGTWLSRWQRV